MTRHGEVIVVAFFLSCVFFWCIGFVIGTNVIESRMKAQAIEANAAHYDSKTGQFVWGGR